jgi:membrane protein YdbS with pleckstrin-like domain
MNSQMGSYPSWLRRFTVNKLAIATACSTHAYPNLNLLVIRELVKWLSLLAHA